MRPTAIVLTIALITILSACALTNADSVNPDLDIVQNPVKSMANTLVWGIWNISGTDSGIFDITPVRHADLTLNAVGWLNSDPASISINMINVDYGPGYVDVTLDVSISHPFAGAPKFTGFDVMGVLMGSGSLPHPFDSTLIYAGDTNQRLLNPDGYTRWMNYSEFSGTSPKAFGYQDGALGTPSLNPSATLNPYKYFCDGLGAEDDLCQYLSTHSADRGMFTSGSTNTRRYEIRFPSAIGIKFQYAVVASWVANVNSPDPPVDIPGDFPPEANMLESPAANISCSASDMWWDGSEGGGNFRAEISILNWHAAPDAGNFVDDYAIDTYSQAWSGALKPDMTAVDFGDNFCTFYIDTPVSPALNGTVDCWLTISHPGITYANELGIPTGADDKTLASHFGFQAVVSPVNPNQDFWTPPTDHPPRFLYIHHSVGQGLLDDGGMWTKLENAGFDVHDRTYGDGWVGDNTNVENWPTTFTDYYEDMMMWEMPPGEQYDIVAFKSCFPTCDIVSDEMLQEYYGYYATVKAVCQANPNALFIPWSPPPLNKTEGNPDRAARARTFSAWLTTTYDNGEYNIIGFDCFDILAGDNPAGDDFNHLKNEYSEGDDSHPNPAGSAVVADAFTAWLVDVVWP